MGAMGATVANLTKRETWDAVGRGVHELANHPTESAAYLPEKLVDPAVSGGQYVWHNRYTPGNIMLVLNQDPRGLGQVLGGAAATAAAARSYLRYRAARTAQVSALAEEPSQSGPFTRDPYAGLRAVSRYLRDQGVPRDLRKDIIDTFVKETIRMRQAAANEYGFRYYDDIRAIAKNRFLFETFPASRMSLALPPEWNQMLRFAQWRICEGATIIEGQAASQGYWTGGQIQKFVLNLEDLLEP